MFIQFLWDDTLTHTFIIYTTRYTCWCHALSLPLSLSLYIYIYISHYISIKTKINLVSCIQLHNLCIHLHLLRLPRLVCHSLSQVVPSLFSRSITPFFATLPTSLHWCVFPTPCCFRFPSFLTFEYKIINYKHIPSLFKLFLTLLLQIKVIYYHIGNFFNILLFNVNNRVIYEKIIFYLISQPCFNNFYSLKMFI